MPTGLCLVPPKLGEEQRNIVARELGLGPGVVDRYRRGRGQLPDEHCDGRVAGDADEYQQQEGERSSHDGGDLPHLA